MWQTFLPHTRRYVPDDIAVYRSIMMLSNLFSNVWGLSSSSEQEMNGVDRVAVVMQRDKIGEAQNSSSGRTSAV